MQETGLSAFNSWRLWRSCAHSLFAFKKNNSYKVLEEVKSHSSKWIKSIDKGLENFYWQDGYGAFSVNPAETDTVIKYISNQRAHHRFIGFSG